jgi:hypothetical protein
MSIEIWGLEVVGADKLGISFPCRHCDEIVDGITEPATEDGETHLACAIASGELDAHVCASCAAYSKHEITDAAGRCGVCVEIAEEEAAEAAARALAVEQAAKAIGFTAYRTLRGVITMGRVGQPYRSTHGELQWLRKLAALGLVACKGARTVGGKAYAYDYTVTSEGLAVAAVWEAVAAKVSGQARRAAA